jgi:hypothetical protein
MASRGGMEIAMGCSNGEATEALHRRSVDAGSCRRPSGKAVWMTVRCGTTPPMILTLTRRTLMTWAGSPQKAMLSATTTFAMRSVPETTMIFATGADIDFDRDWNGALINRDPGELHYLTTHFVMGMDDVVNKAAGQNRVRAADFGGSCGRRARARTPQSAD